jgi:hypothetical protein
MDHEPESSALNMPQHATGSMQNKAITLPDGSSASGLLPPSPAGMLLPPAMSANLDTVSGGGTQLLQKNVQHQGPTQAAIAHQTDQRDDAKSLDSEWVDKAKEIVEKTHNDPYVQSREIGKVRCQYLKAQYNKDIKTPAEPQK